MRLKLGTYATAKDASRFAGIHDYTGDKDVVARLDIRADGQVTKLSYVRLQIVDLDDADASGIAGAFQDRGGVPRRQGGNDG